MSEKVRRVSEQAKKDLDEIFHELVVSKVLQDSKRSDSCIEEQIKGLKQELSSKTRTLKNNGEILQSILGKFDLDYFEDEDLLETYAHPETEKICITSVLTGLIKEALVLKEQNEQLHDKIMVASQEMIQTTEEGLKASHEELITKMALFYEQSESVWNEQENKIKELRLLNIIMIVGMSLLILLFIGFIVLTFV